MKPVAFQSHLGYFVVASENTIYKYLPGRDKWELNDTYHDANAHNLSRWHLIMMSERSFRTLTGHSLKEVQSILLQRHSKWLRTQLTYLQNELRKLRRRGVRVVSDNDVFTEMNIVHFNKKCSKLRRRALHLKIDERHVKRQLELMRSER